MAAGYTSAYEGTLKVRGSEGTVKLALGDAVPEGVDPAELERLARYGLVVGGDAPDDEPTPTTNEAPEGDAVTDEVAPRTGRNARRRADDVKG